MWPQIFIECNKIQIHTVQYQLNAHQHGDKVSPGEEAVDADKEQCGADE